MYRQRVENLPVERTRVALEGASEAEIEAVLTAGGSPFVTVL